MTLRDLINSVDSEQYSDRSATKGDACLSKNPLYKKLRATKPEYGYIRRIQVKEQDGQLVITNAHVGSLGDILTYVIEVAPELNISKVQLLDAILQEMSKGGFSEDEESAFWDDFDNLQKAKIIR